MKADGSNLQFNRNKMFEFNRNTQLSGKDAIQDIDNGFILREDIHYSTI
jgi:hypothetical protein